MKGTIRAGSSLRVVEPGRKVSKKTPTVVLGKNIEFDAAVLDTYGYRGWAPIHHDLLVVCAAVEYADRRQKRRSDRWSRVFNVTVPVHEIQIWNRQATIDSLRATLSHLTGDEWHFSFIEWKGKSLVETPQRLLPLAGNKSFVIAYSDGLDSRCVAGLHGATENAYCVRVARNNNRVRKGDSPFDQIPFRVCMKRTARESSFRSRGFKFAAVTAIAAHIAGIQDIIVPESGQGALGPALLPLHNIYPDYRNHPTYFRKMEEFIRVTLDHCVRYDQPRLWSTKGQTVAEYKQAKPSEAEKLDETRSCWQQRWNAKMNGKLRQCGLCAACLLRRMSMYTARIPEPRDAYVISDLGVPRFTDALPGKEHVRISADSMVEYGCVGVRHMHQLAIMAGLPDHALRVHSFDIARSLDNSERQTLENLKAMLNAHAQEWQSFLSNCGPESFLNQWAIGGRYGRSK